MTDYCSLRYVNPLEGSDAVSTLGRRTHSDLLRLVLDRLIRCEKDGYKCVAEKLSSLSPPVGKETTRGNDPLPVR